MRRSVEHLLRTASNWARRSFAHWSIFHFLFDLGLSTVLTVIFGALAGLTVAQQVFLALGLVTTIGSAIAIWINREEQTQQAQIRNEQLSSEPDVLRNAKQLIRKKINCMLTHMSADETAIWRDEMAVLLEHLTGPETRDEFLRITYFESAVRIRRARQFGVPFLEAVESQLTNQDLKATHYGLSTLSSPARAEISLPASRR